MRFFTCVADSRRFRSTTWGIRAYFGLWQELSDSFARLSAIGVMVGWKASITPGNRSAGQPNQRRYDGQVVLLDQTVAGSLQRDHFTEKSLFSGKQSDEAIKTHCGSVTGS